MNTKVVAGQVWGKPNGGTKFTISRVDPMRRKCYYTAYDGSEAGFGPLTSDGYPEGWGDDWELVEGPKPVVIKGTSSHSDCYSFFAAVAPGECGCKIPKHQCWMHRDS